MNTKIMRHLLSVLCAACVPGVARAADISWVNSAGGNWSAATNWSTGTVPGPEDRAIIDHTGTYTVTVNVNATVAGLELGSLVVGTQTLVLNSSTRTLTLNGPSTVQGGGVLRLSSGTLTGTGDLTIASTFEWQGGTLGGSGLARVEAAGALRFSGSSGKTLSSRTLQNAGLIQLNGTGSLTLSGNALLENQSGGLIEELADVDVASSGTPRSTWNNAGTFRRTSGNATMGVTTFFNNTGTVEVRSGLLQLGGTGTSSGRFDVGASTVLRFAAGHTVGTAGAIEGAGRVEFTGGSVQMDGTYNVTGGTTVSGTATSVAINGPVVTPGSPVSVSGGTANFGANPLDLTDVVLSGGTLANAAPITVGGSFAWSAGALGGSGTVLIRPSAGLAISGNGDHVLTARTINLEGSGTWTGAGQVIMGGGAVFNIRPGATLDARGDGTLRSSGTPASVLNVEGTLTRSTSLGLFQVTCECNNAGLVQVTSGALGIRGGGTASTDFHGAAGTTLRFSSYELAAESRIASSGTVDFNAGTLSVPGKYEVTGTTLVSGSTVSFTGANPALGETLTVTGGAANLGDASVTVTNVNLSSGTLSGAGVLSVAERLTWTGGTLGGAGTTRVLPGAALALSGSGTRTLSGQTLSLAGSGTWTGTGTTAMNSQSTFVVEAGGVLELQGEGTLSSSGSPASTFINLGTVIRDTGSGIFSASAPTTQSGLLELRTGTLRVGSTWVQTAGVLRLAGGALTTSAFLDLRGGLLTGSGTINGAVGNAAQISPGTSPGVIQVLGANGWTNTASGTVLIELAGTTAGADYDQLVTSGRAALGGTLEVRLADGYVPSVGDSFEILRFASATGAFASYKGLSLSRTLYLSPERTTTNLVLVAGVPPGPVVGTPVMLPEGGGVRLQITEAADMTVILDATTDFTTWTSILTNLNSPPLLELVDKDAVHYPYRFYRARIE